MFQQLPTAGLPFQFEQWSQLEGYVDDMLHTGVIDEFDEIRWDLRPSPKFGTLEVRDLRRHPVDVRAAEHLGADALPGRALLLRARRRSRAADRAAVVRPGEQVALGALRDGRDPDPRQARRGGARHDRPAPAARPAGARRRAARLHRRAGRHPRDRRRRRVVPAAASRRRAQRRRARRRGRLRWWRKCARDIRCCTGHDLHHCQARDRRLLVRPAVPVRLDHLALDARGREGPRRRDHTSTS